MEGADTGQKHYLSKSVLAFIVSFAMVCFFLVIHHEIYLPIGKNLSDYSGDGVRNLYTFAYYLNYDRGVHFSGLFFPFKEHIIYMDAQPFWVWVIHLTEKLFHFHVENPIVYIHLILLLNVFLCSFFIFLILFHYCEHYVFATVGTFIIVLMSPQLFRFSSHYALGNMGIFPLFWYGYIQLAEHAKIFKRICYLIALSLTGYIHPYMLLMLVFFFLSYEFIYSITYRRIRYINLLTTAGALFIFQLNILLADTVTDRPTKAWGAKEYASKLHDILLPLDGSIKQQFIKWIPKIPTGCTEGHAYITIFGIVVILLLLIRFFSALISGKLNPRKPENGSAAHWLIASIPVLLFAFFIPFRWNMDWLINSIPPLKQFRGTGRFAVVFYYSFLVYSFVYLKNLYDRKPKTIFALLVVCFVITVFDIFNNAGYLTNYHRKYGKYNAYDESKEKCTQLVSKIKNIQDYQCIITYPPSTGGTEVMWLSGNTVANIYSLWVSYFYHLPIAAVNSGRASYSNTMSLVQLAGAYSSPKPILNKFDKNKHCLVFTSADHLEDNIPLLKDAVYIDRLDDLIVLDIDLNKLPATTPHTFKPTWIDSSYRLMGETTFDHLKNGSLALIDNNNMREVLTVQTGDSKNDKTIRVLFWYTPKLTNDSEVPVVVAYTGKEKGAQTITAWREIQTQTYNYVNGWFCVDYKFTVSGDINTVTFKASSKDIIMDNFSVYLQQ